MAKWEDTTWNDSRIFDEEFDGGPLIRLSYPDGTILFGNLTMEPLRQNDRVLMVRMKNRYAGDSYFNVHEAVVAVFVGEDPVDTRE